VFTGESGAFSTRCKTSMTRYRSAAALWDAFSFFMTVWNPDAPASAPGFTTSLLYACGVIDVTCAGAGVGAGAGSGVGEGV